MLPACLAVGLLAVLVLPNGGTGLGLVTVAVATGAAVPPAARDRLTPWTAALGAVAYGLFGMAMFRDADWLVALLLPAGFLLAALALSGAGRGWLGIARGGASVVLGLPPVPWFLAAPLKSAEGVPLRRRLAPVLVGGALTLVLVLLFGALFASADAVFADAVQRVFLAQDWVGTLPVRIVLFVTFVAVVASAVLVGLRPVNDPRARSRRFEVGRGVWLTPLVALDLLFGVFVAMRFTVLFGGARRVVSAAGLTYAEYARSGFFQLAAVGVFVLAIVAVASGTVRLRGRERWLRAGLLGLLCALTRAALLAFGVWNPDLRVAETQVTIRGGDRLDQAYLGGLGAEAVPALDRLPEPARSCVLRDLVAANGLAAPDPWNGWNLARQRAREVLERRPLLGGNCPAGRSFAG